MKKKIFSAIGLAVMFITMLITKEPIFRMLGIFVGSIWLWITSSIELGSIACLAALCLLDGVSPGEVFSVSFGSSTIMFLIFSFLVTYALSATGVLRRIAIYFIDNSVSKKNVHFFMGLYFLSILLIGSFMAPTTVFILYFSIVQEIFALMGLEKGDKLARNLMVGTGFFASISCAMTPIAHTFPLMAMGYYEAEVGEAISYVTYLKFGLPVGILLALAAYGLLSIGIKNDYDLSAVKFENTGWKKPEVFSVVIFGAVVACWILTGIFPKAFSSLNALGTAWPAMIGCVILTFAGCLNIKEGFTKGVSWSAILLCSATLALGSFLTRDQFGIMPAVKAFVEPFVDKLPMLLMITVFAVVLTNLISNIVTTTVAFNLFVPVIIATGVYSPVYATVAIGICASLAYALPSSIAHIALAGSSGWATGDDMLKYGSAMSGISIAVVMLVMSILA